MFRYTVSLVAVSTVAILAGCVAPTSDAQSNDEAISKKSDDAFLMGLLERAGVPEVAPPAHVLGVGPSVTANIDLKVVSGGFTGRVTKSGEVTADDGTVYGEVSDSDMSRVGKLLVKGGVEWVKGQVRCCDIPVTDTLTATVSCHTIVAPHSPVECTITAVAPVVQNTDDTFMYNLLTSAGVDPDSTDIVPGRGATYTAHVRLSTGGIAGVELGQLSWGRDGSAALDASDLPHVEQVLGANGSTWGAVGPASNDELSTLESVVSCTESVTLNPVAHCTYEAANIRPL